MLTKPSVNINYVDYIHQDLESASCLAFIVFWTDVSKLNGETKIFPGNHLFLYDRRLSNYIGKPLIKYLVLIINHQGIIYQHQDYLINHFLFQQ